MNGSVSDTEWLDIVCENDRARVKNLFTQYQKQDSNSFAVTTTIEDANNKRMLVDLTFESSENNVRGWLKKGSVNTNLKLNIEERFTASATKNN